MEERGGKLEPTYDFQTPVDRPLEFTSETTYSGDPSMLVVPALAHPDVFPKLMGADIGGIDVTHGIGRDPRCRGAAVDSAQIGRIGNKGAQRTVDGAADHDATQLARLRSCRLVATRRLIAECGADIKRIVRPDKDRAWLAELIPGGDEIAVLIENLDATVAAVCNIDTPERAADENVVRIIEIAGSRSFVAPGLDEPAVLGKFNDTAVIRLIRRMAIGGQNIAIGGHRRAGRTVENNPGAAGRHGVETTMENPDVAVAMDMNADDFAPAAAIHAWGQGRPVFHKAIGIGEVGWIGILRLLGACCRCQAGHEHPGEKDHTGLRCRHHSEPPCNQHSHCTANCRANFTHIESGNGSTVAALMSDSSGAQVFVKVGFQLWWVGISSRLPPSHAGEPPHTSRWQTNMTATHLCCPR